MIVAAAIKCADGEVVRNMRYYRIIQMPSDCIQGFVDHTGKFYTRAEAKAEALKYNQIKPEHQGELYSEDLWPEGLERTD